MVAAARTMAEEEDHKIETPAEEAEAEPQAAPLPSVATEAVAEQVLLQPATPPEPKVQPADGPLLRIEGVVKKFGGFRAVDGVSLDIRAGEFFALLGPSGCGKTTLLRILAGFQAPDEGQTPLGGQDNAHVLPHERPITLLCQNYALFPHLSRRDN